MPPPISSSRSCSPSAERRRRELGARCGWLALLLAACGGSPPPEPAPAASGPPLHRTAAAPVAAARAAATGAAPSPAPEPAADPFAGAPFPPPPVEPMHARTAAEADGTWRPLIEGEPAVMQTTLHPDPIKKWVFVTFVAFDRKHLDLSLVPGTEEPATDAVPEERRTGLVPQADQGRLLVVFNGGFKARHGNYGMRIGADEYVPPRDEGCTVAAYRSGELKIRSWPVVAGEVDAMRFYRQTPPCLVEQRTPSDKLPGEARTKWWGSAEGGKLDIRRSALALDASGRSMIYAFGDWVTAQDLTRALMHLGVVDAAQLDINWSYTRFFVFQHPDGSAPRIASTIIPELEFSRNRYVEKPSYRDFFYVTRR